MWGVRLGDGSTGYVRTASAVLLDAMQAQGEILEPSSGALGAKSARLGAAGECRSGRAVQRDFGEASRPDDWRDPDT
jgi:hypothetical protein